jgi:hypothetical protein
MLSFLLRQRFIFVRPGLVIFEIDLTAWENPHTSHYRRCLRSLQQKRLDAGSMVTQ